MATSGRGMLLPAGVHPKWLTCFPNGVHRWDDGTPDEDDDALAPLGGEGEDEPPESPEDRRNRVLREMGF